LQDYRQFIYLPIYLQEPFASPVSYSRISSCNHHGKRFFSLACFLNHVNAKPGLLKWRTAVRIRTFGWWRPDLVSLLKVYPISRSFYPKMVRFWLCF